MSHERVICSCGRLIRQCRCIKRHADTVIPNGCDACKAAQVPELPPCPNHGQDLCGCARVPEDIIRSVSVIRLESAPYHGKLPEGALDRIREHLTAELDRLILEALVCGR